MRKFIFVTGGVLSGLGKGVVAASIGLLFKLRGYRVTLQKIDPYVNLDAGTMNPYEHGEVFVTRDGLETDLDIGRYERFLDEELTRANYLTTGQVYWNVIRQERAGAFLGKTVQVIPHITDEIKRLIQLPLDQSGAQIAVVEVGGTVGDIEGLPFLEALRQLKDDLPREDTFFVHLTLLPLLSTSDELKTKPTQHSVKELRAIGIQPDAIVARCGRPLPESVKRKIALFCDVDPENVIEDPDLASIYEVPLVLRQQGFDRRIAERLGIGSEEANVDRWSELVSRLRHPSRHVRIGVVGKYVELKDSYISIGEALVHAGVALDTEVNVDWIPAEAVARDGPALHLDGVDGLLVPGGFGDRGIEGKVEAVRHVREHGIPFLGLCLGLQCAAIEFARDRLGLTGANSSEFAPDTPHPVIDLLEEQAGVKEKGGTMRLGSYPTLLRRGSKSRACYGVDRIDERHRHRYEFNSSYRERFETAGMRIVGTSPDDRLVEIIELADHPWFVGVQFHPEFKSHFLSPHPLFSGFLRACIERGASSSSPSP
ncbi:MAG: CTP synthase [Candidatus Bipolaricaulota bacterium]|nr:CTP synthase [Candidatus Bipolaricaulota bacterium]